MGSRSFRVHTCDLLISCSSEQFYSIKYAISVNFYIYTSFLQYTTSIHYYYKVPSCIFFSFSFIFWRYCPSHHSLSNKIRRIHRVRTCQKICQDVADNDHTPFFIQNWQKVDFALEFASFFVHFSSWLFCPVFQRQYVFSGTPRLLSGRNIRQAMEEDTPSPGLPRSFLPPELLFLLAAGLVSGSRRAFGICFSIFYIRQAGNSDFALVFFV